MSQEGKNDDRARTIELLENLQARYTKGPFAVQTGSWSDQHVDHLTQYFADIGYDVSSSEIAEFGSRILSKPLITRYQCPFTYDLMQEIVVAIKPMLDGIKEGVCANTILATAPTGKFNGTVYSAKSSSWKIILLEDGVFGLCNMLSKVLALMTTVDDRFSFDDDPKVHVNHAVGALRLGDLIASYVVRGFPNSARPYLVPERLLQIQMYLCQCMEIFVVAHEFGHIALDHLSSKSSTGEKKLTVEEAISLNHSQELEADAFALSILLKYASEKKCPLDLALAAVTSLFYFLMLLESAFGIYDPVLLAKRALNSRPNAGERVLATSDAIHRILTFDEDSHMQFIKPCNYYRKSLVSMWESNSAMIEGVAKTFDVRPHRKWYA